MTPETRLGIQDAAEAAINANATGGWIAPSRRENYRARILVAVMDNIGPLIQQAINEEIGNYYNAGKAELDASREAGRSEGIAKGRKVGERVGYDRGRAAALHEAATMLKRHGHRTAVTRVQALAETPARPQPAQSPADGPGHPAAEPPAAPGMTRNTENGLTGAPEGPTGPSDGTSAPDPDHAERAALAQLGLRRLHEQARRG